MTRKYSVHECVKYNYSDIGKYIGEEYTNEPIRNDELVQILNMQYMKIKGLEAELETYKTIVNSRNKRIKELETELENYKTLQFRKTVKYRRDY